jgi:hypothetical protein
VQSPELLRLANRRSDARFGPPLTDRMLEDLAFEGVLPRAKRSPLKGKRGANYVYSRESLRAAVWIRWLKNHGVKRFPDLRLHLWLIGFDAPLHVIRVDLRHECSRRIKFLLRFVRSTHRPGPHAASLRTIATIVRQLGPGDERLRSSEAFLKSNMLFWLYELMVFGEASKFQENPLRTLQDALNELGSGLDGIEALLVAIVSGALGDEEEIESSMLETISKSTEKQLYYALGIGKHK